MNFKFYSFLNAYKKLLKCIIWSCDIPFKLNFAFFLSLKKDKCKTLPVTVNEIFGQIKKFFLITKLFS